MTTKQQTYDEAINEMAEKLFDADFDEIKKQVAYMTSEESGYALGCDTNKVGSDVLSALTRIRAERASAEADWEAEQAAQIKNELEHEIATLKERIERKEKVGYFEGKRGRAMRRHYERKLANAEAIHAELLGDGEQTDEIEQAAQVVKDAGGVVVLPENRERFDAQLKQLHNAEGACDAALAKVNKLTAAIDDMKHDCDGEVYETLLAIADILGR